MRASLHSWWQKLQHHPFIATGIIVLLITCIAFVLAVHWLGWDWTGFNGYSPPTPQYQRGKMLWDWLQLLVIPLMLAIGGYWLNQIQKNRDERAIEHRDKTEREIAADNQREAALHAYLDKMSELLLEKDLRKSAEDDEVGKIARVRTLTVLSRLDGGRKGSVLKFLYESGLIHGAAPIIDLQEADLRGVILCEVSLCEVNLRGAILGKAILSGIDLRGAILSKTDMQGANLYGAILREADLTVAVLREVDLSVADLGGAMLMGTDLDKALVSSVQLDKVKSLKGAIMPDGSIHP